MEFTTLTYEVDGRVATISLNRPQRLNAINEDMPAEIAGAVDRAEADDDVHVVVVTGIGRAFSAGYDLVNYAESEDAPYSQEMPWDPMLDYRMMSRNTEQFMRLFWCHKPTVAKIRGYAVAGGSDIALACDMVIMAEDAKIGYPPSRVWGCPTTAMWVYRLGPEKAKRMLFTGDLVTGTEAAAMGLVLEAVPEADLDERVAELAQRMSGVPRNQLMMQKLMINQAVENLGLRNTQMVATIFDGITRHSPEGMWFKQRAEEVGFVQAVRERDSGDPIAPGVSKRMAPRQ